jgi:hypothetical protein
VAVLLHRHSDSRREAIRLLIFSLIACSMMAGCARLEAPASSTTPTPTPAPITQMNRLTVTGLTTVTAPGQTTQLTARAGFSDGSTQDVTNQATWQSSNTDVATVSGGGLVRAVTFGHADVTAAFQSFSEKVSINLPLDVTGLWRGTARDATGSSTLALGLTQQGPAITGTATITLSNGRPGGGTFSGTVANVGPTVTFTIVTSSSNGNRTCTLTLNATAQATATTLTGTYTGTDSCDGNIGSGTMTLTKQ